VQAFRLFPVTHLFRHTFLCGVLRGNPQQTQAANTRNPESASGSFAFCVCLTKRRP
jgi:hypothetical protein